MSSLKMTFSLTSLIFLIALGLVFAPTSVMAHSEAQRDLGNTDRSLIIGAHTDHPVTEATTYRAAAQGVTEILGIPLHGPHPVPTITLKQVADVAKDKEAIITATDNIFSVVISFDVPVDDADNSTAAAADIGITDTNFGVLLLDKKGNPVTNNATIAAAARVAPGTATLAATHPIEAVVTIPAASVPTGTGDMSELTIRVQLNANAGVYSFQTQHFPGTTVTPIPGGQNVASELAEFKLVQRLTVAPPAPDDMAPTVMITKPEELTAGKAVFKIDFMGGPLGNGPSDFGFSDLEISGGTATADDLNEAAGSTSNEPKWTLSVTPTGGPITVSLRPNAVSDMAGNEVDHTADNASATYDTTPPMITITSAAGMGDNAGKVIFTIDSDEMLGMDAYGLSIADLSVTNAALLQTADLMPVTDDLPDGVAERHTLTVTPTDATMPNRLDLAASSVADASGNMAAGVREIYTPPAPPAPPAAPTNLMAEVGDGQVTLTWTAATTGGDATSFEYRRNGGTAMEIADSDGDTDDHTVTGLTNGTPYTFEVRAINADGPSAWSDEVSATPMAPAVVEDVSPIVTITKPTELTAGKAVFMIGFNEALGTGPSGFQISDLEISGGTATADDLNEAAGSTDAAPKWTLSVTPTGGPIMVSLRPNAVADATGNEVDHTAMGASATYDTTPPSLVSSSFAVSTTNADHLIVTLVFDEDVDPDTIDIDDARGNGASKADSASAVTTADHTYTVPVNAPGHATREKTYMSLEAGVTDMAGNETTSDIELVYTSPMAAVPTVAITANPNPINCDTGSTISFAITGSTEKLVAADITVSAGWVVGTDNDPSDGSIMIVPDGNAAIGVTTVTVTVAANAVGSNAATPATFTVGPVLTIPPGGYILVNHPVHTDTHLSDPLRLGSTAIRAPAIIIQKWECMPDLTVFFGRSAPAIGGGAIVIKEADGPMGYDPGGTKADIAKGSVGISEIMWASDEGIQHGGIADPNTGRLSRTNYDQTREQWIELHNRNSTEVKVTLFARPTTTAHTTETDEIDRVSNFNINNDWAPKGQSGNSETGVDFVSMQRGKHDNAGLAPNTAQGYAHGDWNGSHANRWTVSTHSYLTARAGLWQTLPIENQNYDFLGTPGRDNKLSVASSPRRTNVPKDSIVFNEIANRRDQTLEWIELKNVSDAEVNLKKYQISLATAKGTDVAFYTFPDNDNIKLAAGELLLLLDTDPRDNDDHPIAVAFNRDGGNDQALGIGDDAIKYKVANFREGGLPDDGNFVLFLRKSNDKLGQAANVIDLIGWSNQLEDTAKRTKVWPLDIFGDPDTRNSIAVEAVHRRQHRIDPDKNTHGDDKDEHQALRDVGYTGIGYKRHAQNVAAHGGTPGHEDTRKNLVADISSTGTLTISEIMYDQGDGDYPQWIEIYNSSPTQPVNLHSEAGWRLVVENFDDDEIPIARLSGTLNFKNSEVQTILPQQTVIVASTRARSSGSAFFDTRVIFPATRVFSVWDDQRGELGMQRSRDPILSTQGFYIELIDGKGNFSDGVGNLVKSPNRRVAATIEWVLSDINGGMGEDMPRSSILRKYNEYKDNKLVGRYSDAEIEDMGVTADGWRAAYQTDFLDVRKTWYGHESDYGTPGITSGRVLPVSLSKFRPERLDTGEIVVRWITESELNNAGFNILRSETRNGEFTKINTSLIAGQGTTSERTAYEWKDTSAKPNVVYYYQIQDVSLDGKVQTLRQSRLKGNVTPAGKLTTTWGELRTLQ